MTRTDLQINQKDMWRTDLLVIGLRQHSSHVARLWSTVSNLEQKAQYSVLSVHAFSGRVREKSARTKALDQSAQGTPTGGNDDGQSANQR